MPVEPEITDDLVAQHGISPDEYASILDLLGRVPTFTELGIFSAMWNEHCSYKSSKKWLKTLPTTGDCVIQGPGENAGVVDIGNGKVAIFKMESHNHPSYIEPYQGAATGVGGILRDVFTMGARPVAAMNALRFGSVDHERTKHLLNGVVAGVGGYGNSFGVPTVGGEVEFHTSYDGNCLVNAFALGIADADKVFYSKASGIGLPVVYLGAKTGRDGIHGATMASAEFGEGAAEQRPTVQVGDPFTEKCLLEACLELMAGDTIVAIQDMGAAGLTCSAVEMGAKGDLGIDLDLDKVPCREEAMSAYEMMLSESQERMLMVLKPSHEDQAAAIFDKWGLDFAVVGKTTDDLRFRVRHGGVEVADLPIKELGDAAPEYERPWVEPKPAQALDSDMDFSAPGGVAKAVLSMVGSENLSSRRWVWEQYDHLIQGNTVQIPGGDAGVIRIEGETRGLACSSDVNPRYVYADPFEGGKQAVAECWRNLSAVGAKPLAATDNLNFGNPEKPEIMGQFVQAIKGIGEACSALDFPIVSGNVSLYNETHGQAILPTPTMAGIGLIDDIDRVASASFGAIGDEIILIGGAGSHLGQSRYLQIIHDLEAGTPPSVDLDKERTHGAFIRDLISQGHVKHCHDISDGGLAIALTEMAISSGLGFDISAAELDEFALFGEDQGRYVVSCASDVAKLVQERAGAKGIHCKTIGMVRRDGLIYCEGQALSLSDVAEAHGSWFRNYTKT